MILKRQQSLRFFIPEISYILFFSHFLHRRRHLWYNFDRFCLYFYFLFFSRRSQQTFSCTFFRSFDISGCDSRMSFLYSWFDVSRCYWLVFASSTLLYIWTGTFLITVLETSFLLSWVLFLF